jgi:hypothetical protein
MTSVEIPVINLEAARETIEKTLNGIEENDAESWNKGFVFFFHEKEKIFSWLLVGEEWDAEKSRLQNESALSTKSSFRDVWKSASGCFFKVIYHQFSDQKEFEHSFNSGIMMAFRNRNLPCALLYIEFSPITEKEFERLEEAYRVTCSAGSGCSASGLSLCCGRCQKALYCSAECQKKHWPVHKAQCK